MQKLKLWDGRKAPLSLHIVVVGCGLGGLAAAHTLAHAGHRVTLVESAPAIGEVGAGIQVTPNLSRLLIRWGLGQALKDIAVVPEAIAFRRYNTGELIGWTKWGDTMEKNYGSPYYHIHRADFHRLLYDLAVPLVTLRLASTVVKIDPSPATGPSITLKSGEVIRADLIVGADGVKSMIRDVVVGGPTHATPTGDAAYRAVIPVDKMLSDPELKSFIENPEMTAWMGPQRHIMAYCIVRFLVLDDLQMLIGFLQRAKKEYNVVLLHPDDGSVESWTAEGSAEKMRKDFEDFEPRIQKILSFIPSTLKWKLMDRQPLATWVHPEGRVVLLGDSCHPMLPYRAQGAAMAVEDAAVLGNLLSRLTHISELPHLLRGYEAIRHTRTANTQKSSRLNQRIFHYPDGPEQEKRDSEMKAAMLYERARLPPDHLRALPEEERKKVNLNEDFTGEGNSNQWADMKKNLEQFGYDADLEADRWWNERGERICRQAVQGAEMGTVSARM